MEPAHTRNIGETRGVILWGSWSAYRWLKWSAQKTRVDSERVLGP